MDRCENCDKVLFEQRFPVTEVFCGAAAKGRRKLKSLAPRVDFGMKSPKWCPEKEKDAADA